MGSKRLMLQNGLGSLIREESPNYSRFVDLFSGASFVSWFVAENIDIPVVSVDLQKYSKVLAESVLSRIDSQINKKFGNTWIDTATIDCMNSKLWIEAIKLEGKRFTISFVDECRKLCKKKSTIGPIWNAYGGHYFSPSQALLIDYLLKHLPKDKNEKNVCLAALIITASKCVASPGHTAQPFQPTKTARKYLEEAWNKNIYIILKNELNELLVKHSNKLGSAIVSDAYIFAKKLNETDLVFIDPPYSGVQYSRFYHVLETIARGKIESKVEGIGRYPSIEERPQSKFSNVGESVNAFDKLLERISKQKSTVIVTFPSGKASNGLSGKEVETISKKWFRVDRKKIKSKFSTLGGNNKNRDARKETGELILLLKPKVVTSKK
ncbi:MAG: DNA adenine methylase [Bacteroidota bacterium]|nr:DNA adenine methylase [Bacteroidota bacterium]